MTEHDTPDAFKTFKEAAEQFNQQPPLKYRDCNNERDYPVPAGHAPRLEEVVSNGFEGIMIQERDSAFSDGDAWIQCEQPWSVEE